MRDESVAAVLSFLFCGLGQIYNGEMAKGFGLILLQCVNIALMFVLIGFITYPLTWAYGICDAYKGAQKKRTGAA